MGIGSVTLSRDSSSEFFWIAAMYESSRIFPSYQRGIIIRGFSVAGIGAECIALAILCPDNVTSCVEKLVEFPVADVPFIPK
jgi:hypothetical protein